MILEEKKAEDVGADLHITGSMWCRASGSEKSSFRRQGPIGAELDGAIDRSGSGSGKGVRYRMGSGNTLSSLVESYKRGEVRQNGAAVVEARPNGRFEPYSGRAEARL
jgi:hypothetical protein